MIKIGFTGDFCPWMRMEELYFQSQWVSAFEQVKPFFSGNDLNVIDLECPLTTEQTAIKKTGPHIKAHPDTASILKHLNCNLVATANNHFRDYGWPGMQSTYLALEKQNIAWTGSGKNQLEAEKTFMFQKDDLQIAIINAAENEWATTTGKQPGCHSLDPVALYQKIRNARKYADFAVVVVHGGHEHYNLPSPRMKKWYRFFVDAGAHAVVGHHTHTVSGFEIYQGAPIFYSLGNFCFDWQGLRDKPWNYGMIVRLLFEKGENVHYEYKFVEQHNQEPGVFFLSNSQNQKFEKLIKELNNIISDDEKLEASYSDYAASLKPLLNTWIQPYRGNLLPGLHKRGLLPSPMNLEKKRLLTNLIRCEAHRDILLQAINPDHYRD